METHRIHPKKIVQALAIAAVLVLTGTFNTSLQAQDKKYLNPDLPVQERVDDLVDRMTLEEKVSQTLDEARAIERLGIPEYNWWNEALHGVARSGLATVFPQAIGLAATWDEPLIHEMAVAISDEARAKHHDYFRKGSHARYQGLTIWSPNINIFRDPRWGRGQETYGEDPYLTGRIATQFIRGLQGDHPKYLKTVSTVKHFAVHSGPEPERHSFNAVVDERDFRETYLPMFQTGIQTGGAYSLMCAYNRVYGEAACGSEYLLEDILREEWDFPGYVVSDCWALNDFFNYHNVSGNATEAAALALKSGTDLDCGSSVYPKLADAVKNGLITEAQVDTTVNRLFTARFKLGMFDPVDSVAYAQIPYDVVDSKEHKELARKVTRKSMVLLKNDGTLPLNKDIGRIAVIGPNADQWLMLLGNYNGIPSKAVTPLEGIREAVSPNTEVSYALGSELAEGFPMFMGVPSNVLSTPDGEAGLKAEYFGDREFGGEALYSNTTDEMDVNWYAEAPREDMDGDNFGVRWTGTLTPEHTGTYQLGTIATMKYQMYLNDSLVSKSEYNYRDELGDPRVQAGLPMKLEAGNSYDIRIEASESYGDAAFQLVWMPHLENLEQEAVETAQDADAVVLFLGLTSRLEGEEMRVEIDGFRGGDRTDIDLPDAQKNLIKKMTELGKPTVLVLLNGSALAVNWADENVPAILEAWYPGQAAGTAIADVLFGDYNPAGRLPLTFYKSVDDLPPFDDYDMAGRTYKYFEGEVLYPFGHGLSYTDFEYANLSTNSVFISEGGIVTVSVDVTNTGDRAGEEIAQLYVSYPNASVRMPNKELVGFKRIELQSGETKTVEFELRADDLRYWNPDAKEWTLEKRAVELQAGASSADIRQKIMLDVK